MMNRKYILVLVLGFFCNIVVKAQNNTYYFCDSAKLVDLDNIRPNLNWYDSVYLTSKLPLSTSLKSKVYYYDSTTILGKTTLDSVRVVLVPTLDSPVLPVVQFFCDSAYLKEVVGFNTNSNLSFFLQISDTFPLPLTTNLSSRIYYASQRANPNTLKCQSLRIPVTINVGLTPKITIEPYQGDTTYSIGDTSKPLFISVVPKDDSLKINWFISQSPTGFNGLKISKNTLDSFYSPFTTPDSIKSLYIKNYNYYYVVANNGICSTTSAVSGKIIIKYLPIFVIEPPTNDTSNICLGAKNPMLDSLYFSFMASSKKGFGVITKFELFRTPDLTYSKGIAITNPISCSNPTSNTNFTYCLSSSALGSYRYFAVITSEFGQTATSTISGLKNVVENPIVSIAVLDPEYLFPDLKYIKIVKGEQLKLKASITGPLVAKNYKSQLTYAKYTWTYELPALSQTNTFFDSIYITYPFDVNSNDITNYTMIKLDASNGYGCSNSDYVNVWINPDNIAKDRLFYVPRIITPSDDNVNDILIIPRLAEANQSSAVSLTIYDQFNNVVFFKEYPKGTYTDFDGNDKDNKKLATGTYYYVLKVMDLKYVQTGFFISVLSSTSTNTN